MTNKEAEQKIQQAFSNAVPNIRDSVLSDCQNQKGAVTIMTEIKRKNPWPRRLAGIAAAFVLLIGGMTGFQVYQANYAVASLISLDVNPSIEITVNQKEQVLSVNARNDDAKIVVGDMDFKGSSLDVTINALIGSMLRNGYLNEMANSILVSVDNEDPAKGAELQERLASEINEVLQTGSFNGAVLSQTISADSDLRKLADTYGITLGKAQLIQQIINQNTFYSFEDLVPLSINELNLLSESGNLNLTNINSLGTASDKAYLGEEKAREAALSHANVPADKITNYEIELDYENGVMVYEIEFKCEGIEYDYDIDAVTGSVLKNQQKPDDDYIPPQSNNTPGSPDSYISEDRAKEAALSHAGITAGDITNFQCRLDCEDDIMVYDIEFHCGGYDYNYGIHATTGTVLKHQWHCDNNYYYNHHNDSHHGGRHHSYRGGSSYIGEAAAKEIALSHAGVSVESIESYKCELDSDNGLMVYEVEFDCSGYEYSYDINALDGTIVKYEKEIDD